MADNGNELPLPIAGNPEARGNGLNLTDNDLFCLEMLKLHFRFALANEQCPFCRNLYGTLTIFAESALQVGRVRRTARGSERVAWLVEEMFEMSLQVCNLQ